MGACKLNFCFQLLLAATRSLLQSLVRIDTSLIMTTMCSFVLTQTTVLARTLAPLLAMTTAWSPGQSSHQGSFLTTKSNCTTVRLTLGTTLYFVFFALSRNELIVEMPLHIWKKTDDVHLEIFKLEKLS